MAAPGCQTARRLLSLSAQVADSDPVAAYLCAWDAFEHLVCVIAARAGVRAQFGLRKNGTVRTRKVGGLKMPVVLPPRPEEQLRVALKSLGLDLCDRLLHQPSVKAFADRVPMLAGRRLTRDARGQRLSGVLDVASTPDPRYPVWSPIDQEQLQRYLSGETEEVLVNDLVIQVAALLNTIRSNLLIVATPDGGDNNAAVAREGLPMLRTLVEALIQGS